MHISAVDTDGGTCLAAGWLRRTNEGSFEGTEGGTWTTGVWRGDLDWKKRRRKRGSEELEGRHFYGRRERAVALKLPFSATVLQGCVFSFFSFFFLST